MRNYLATTVCTLVLGLAVGNAQAACTATPDCASLGYTFTQKDCPVEGVKCPWDETKFYCDTIFHLDDGTIEDCANVLGLVVPANATCTQSHKTCPSKCTAWACNTGYEKVGSKCVKELEPLPSGCSGTKLVCNGQEYCCPTSTGYTSCAEMNAGLQKCFVTADNEMPSEPTCSKGTYSHICDGMEYCCPDLFTTCSDIKNSLVKNCYVNVLRPEI